MVWLILLYNTIVYLGCSAMLFSQTADETFQQTSLKSCVLEIAERYFSQKETITYILGNDSSDTDTVILKRLSQISKWAIITQKRSWTDTESKFLPGLRSQYYLIFIKAEYDIDYALEYLRDYSWNARAHFIVITSKILTNSKSFMVYNIKKLRQNHVLDVVFLLSQVKNPAIIDIYTWFPYSNGNCGNSIQGIEKINRCQNGVMVKDTTIFVKKIPENLNGCPVRVRAIESAPYVIPPRKMNYSRTGIKFKKGLGIKLLNNVARRCNLTLNYTASDTSKKFGLVSPNGTASGTMKELIGEELDMAVGCLIALSNRYIHLDYTVSYVIDHIVWCVPRAQEKPHWLSVFIIFDLQTWMFITSTYLIVSITLWAFSCWQCGKEESPSFRLLSNSFLNALLVIISLSTKQPRTFVVRGMFILWVVFSLHISILYQTQLIRSLVNPFYEEQITTLEQVFENNLEFGFYRPGTKFFDEHGDWIQRKLFKETKYCPNIETCLENIAFRKNYSMLLPKSILEYSTSKFKNHQIEPLLYTFKDIYLYNPIQFYTFKGFPFLKRINKVISNMQQAGLLDKWTKESLRTENILFENSIDPSTDLNDLSVHQLQGAFIVYVIGLLIAAVAFALELMCPFKCKTCKSVRISFT